ncbi:MAG: hypothetical protein GX610_12330 [Rhodococcus sp.]|nr:hypothetical protein [Rhodococcus sp. (in: high G+C Gram-positive bacteria)]
MAENENYRSESSETGQTSADAQERRRPSVLLILAGLTALLVSGWALVGPFTLTPVGENAFRWIFVAIAVVVGLVLVFLPNHRRK